MLMKDLHDYSMVLLRFIWCWSGELRKWRRGGKALSRSCFLSRIANYHYHLVLSFRHIVNIGTKEQCTRSRRKIRRCNGNPKDKELTTTAVVISSVIRHSVGLSSKQPQSQSQSTLAETNWRLIELRDDDQTHKIEKTESTFSDNALKNGEKQRNRKRTSSG